MEEKRIKKLSETVINRIAAGEVIQRPCNVLKELLENSLDAGSTNVRVVVRDGGLKLLQITDNGHGIRKDDLDIVCERFTTSKLQKYDDLFEIGTFGFRGEALASISHVAHLSILTRQKHDECAYLATYSDGHLVPGSTVQPSAGNDGTQITVENLFYNVPTRLKALKSGRDEYTRVLDVLQKYAIHYAGTAISLQKSVPGQTNTKIDLSTTESMSTVDVIRAVYGASVSRDVIPFSFESQKFTINGFISNLNYQKPKTQFILFINHRLVESTQLKRAILNLYSSLLPSGGRPFVYLCIDLDPRCVDVNVHPTKSQVRFLHEDEISNDIAVQVERVLQSSDSAGRKFTQQKFLPTPNAADIPLTPASSSSVTPHRSSNAVPAHKLVRTDASAKKLDSFFGSFGHTLLSSDAAIDDSASTVPAMSSVLSFSSTDADETKEAQAKKRKLVIKGILDSLHEESATPVKKASDSRHVLENGCWLDQVGFSGTEKADYKSNLFENDSSEQLLHNFENESSEQLLQKFQNVSNSKQWSEGRLVRVKDATDEVSKDAPDNEVPMGVSPPTVDSVVELVEEQDGDSSSRRETSQSAVEIRTRAFVDVKLTSVFELRDEVVLNRSEYLLNVCRNFVFVGVVDAVRVLFQSDTRLFLTNIFILTSQMFYQLSLKAFHNFGTIQLAEPISLFEELLAGLDEISELNGNVFAKPPKDLASEARAILLDKASMLMEYFNIVISEQDSSLVALPLMLKGYAPLLDKLPLFLVRLAFHVDWASEKVCFRNICEELGFFYAAEEFFSEEERSLYTKTLEHIVVPALKEAFLPPKSLSSTAFEQPNVPSSLALIKQTCSALFAERAASDDIQFEAGIVQIADLPELYKVFERC